VTKKSDKSCGRPSDMQYAFFLVIAIIYNIRKFSKEKEVFLRSLTAATSDQHRFMILSHHFHVFIFEVFLSFIISYLISDKTVPIGILGFGTIYVLLLAVGLIFYQPFLKFIESLTNLQFRRPFNQHLIKEFRVSFALIMLPILLYSLNSWIFVNENGAESESGLWLIEFLTNIIFVSVLTITCSVIIMLRLIPNRDITEPEYLEIIRKRLTQIGAPKMRIRWIETDIKNAFVVGIKILGFSNQTMFIGKNLRTMLTIEEFDAVIAHELAHVANRHIQKRVIELFKNFVSGLVGLYALILLSMTCFQLYFGEDVGLHQDLLVSVTALTCLGWIFFNYSIFFDIIRSHEFEADAYSVINMGANFTSLRSALEKLTRPEEMPEYLKKKMKVTTKNSTWFSQIAKIFSTHPDLEERIKSLEHKISMGLPFNYYVSRPQKIRTTLSFYFQWKILIPVVVFFGMAGIWSVIQFRNGGQLVTFIRENKTPAILKNNEIVNNINSKPYLVGKSLMFYIVKKQNKELIDYYLAKGADPGRTLVYLTETQNFELFKNYYSALSGKISIDQYYLVLLSSASVNFTDGYRYLVNSSKFDQLSGNFRKEIVSTHKQQLSDRKPASVEEK
jgi:heat shock protein HtpX